MKCVGQISGGLSSWLAAKRMIAKYPEAEHTMLFADTLIEDEDLYRFLLDVERDLETPITRIADGRTPWQVFRDQRFLGNSRVDPCSKVLKRDLLHRWMVEHCDPKDTLVYTGLGWWEEYRHTELAARKAAEGWTYVAPLCEPPLITHPMMEEMAEAAGIAVPRLYKMGFKHNNCGGGCVKAGIGQFAHLYKVMPERFAEWEQNEIEMRRFLGKDVAMLEDRRGGQRKPLPLFRLRARLEGRDEPLEPTEINDVRGCGCAIDYDPAEEEEVPA